jgi:predicted RNase H-like HicB family nuclease
VLFHRGRLLQGRNERLNASGFDYDVIPLKREPLFCVQGQFMRTDLPLTLEIIADPEFGGFTARLPDIPAYGEGATEDEAIADLREALVGYIEAFGMEEGERGASAP